MIYHFIINPRSKTGTAIKYWRQIEQVLSKRKIAYTAQFTRYAGHAVYLTRELIKKYPGKKTLIIVGGDGTINEVINGLSDYSTITLGYIPAGSGNDLARGLLLPKNHLAALEQLLSHSRVYLMDLGLLTCYDRPEKLQRKFVVSSGIGYDASVGKLAVNSKLKLILNKAKLGKLTYLLLGLWQIIINKPANAELIIDGIYKKKFKKVSFIASMIQTCEGGGLSMAPAAKNNDGLLTLCIVSGISNFRMLMLLPALILGKHMHKKGVTILQCKSVEIKTDTPLTVHTDGEFNQMQQHIHITCQKQVLRFIL